MAHDPGALAPEVLAFLTERHLATLTTLRPDGRPHVVPVGFTFDPGRGVARVITDGASRKVRNVEAGIAADRAGAARTAAGRDGAPRAVLCQVDRARWLSLEGRASILRDPTAVAEAVAAYATRYRSPRSNPTRVVLEVAVDRVLGRG